MAEDTWFARDLLVLDWLVTRLEAEPEERLTQDKVAAALDLPVPVALAALRRLDEAQPPYLKTRNPMGPYVWVLGVTERARREVGAWPTAESLADRLVARLNEEADREPDPERKIKLRETARYLGGAARDVVVDVAATFAARAAGM